MPFKETCSMEERVRILSEYDTGAFTVSELAERYGVSRETFYVWLKRRGSGDERWFEDRPHAARSCPHRTAGAVVAAVVRLRERFPHFGPKKLHARLVSDRPDRVWPAAWPRIKSGVGDILKREGLMRSRERRRRRVAGAGAIAPHAMAANAEWCTDFKGWFRTRDGRRCDPLTLTDTMSRYLIATRIVEPTYVGVRAALERVFAENGLPWSLRCDNGPPFGSAGAGGLSRLSVWWLRLEIEPHFIRPASPQENGRHERMHRVLKEETSTPPPAATVVEQQARFDAFRRHYNEERPHEALGQTPPAAHWQPSVRPFKQRPEEPWYDANHEVRRVRPDGTIKWRGEPVFIGEALVRELIGLKELEGGGHLVRFCRRELGIVGRSHRFVRFAPPYVKLVAEEDPHED